MTTLRAFAYGFTGDPLANAFIAGLIVIGSLLLLGAFA